MSRNLVLATALALVASGALAQAAAPAGGKKELALKIVQMQQPAIEGMARQLVEMPAAQLLQQAGPAVQQRVAADKREAVWQDIQGDARRYVEEAMPIVRDRATKLAPQTLAPVLEEKLTEDELRQVLQVMQQLDSPAYRKYNALGGDLQKALGEKLIAETRGQVEPKMQALQASVSKRLGVSPKPAGAASGASGAADAKKK
jgi:uncharacterized protein